MSTITAPQPAAPRAAGAPAWLVQIVTALAPGRCVVVSDVSWDEYWRLVLWRDEYRTHSVRLTFDRGELSIRVVTNERARLKKFVDTFVTVWLCETNTKYLLSGELTHNRADLERGFEPDECYYVQNWRKVTGTREIDFNTDPPPDLMIDVETGRTVASRLSVIAAFQIPEVWRYDGARITPLALQPNGTYAEVTASAVLPGFPFVAAAEELARALTCRDSFVPIRQRFHALALAHAPNT
jgi:Uma2 family endonuclease